jgi:hypothetical protein
MLRKCVQKLMKFRFGFIMRYSYFLFSFVYLNQLNVANLFILLRIAQRLLVLGL